MRLLVWVLIQFAWCPNQKRLGHKGIPKEDHVKTGKIQPLTRQGGRPQKKSTLLIHWAQTYSFHNCLKMNFCCLATQSLLFCYSNTSKLRWIVKVESFQWLKKKQMLPVVTSRKLNYKIGRTEDRKFSVLPHTFLFC